MALNLRGTVFAGFFACVSLVAAFATVPWESEVASLRAGSFPAPPEFRARYVFGWSGIEAAAADVVLRRESGDLWAASVKGGTTGWVRSLWKLDADYSAALTAADWRSLSYTLEERYRTYRAMEKTEFTAEGARSWRESSKDGSRAPKWKTYDLAGLRDMAAALLLARSQALEPGQWVRLGVFPGEGMYMVHVTLEGREQISLRGKDRSALRVSLHIDRITKNHSLEPHRKFQRGTVWVSDDEARIPLRVEVKVFIGSVFAELVSFDTGK